MGLDPRDADDLVGLDDGLDGLDELDDPAFGVGDVDGLGIPVQLGPALLGGLEHSAGIVDGLERAARIEVVAAGAVADDGPAARLRYELGHRSDDGGMRGSGLLGLAPHEEAHLQQDALAGRDELAHAAEEAYRRGYRILDPGVFVIAAADEGYFAHGKGGDHGTKSSEAFDAGERGGHGEDAWI